MYVYQQAEGRRHLRRSVNRASLEIGNEFRSLCGKDCTVGAKDDRHLVDVLWLDPACERCHAIWVDLTGLVFA